MTIKRYSWDRYEGVSLDDDGDLVDYDDYIKEITALKTTLESLIALGHNDDCMFCGFKDKIAKKAIKEITDV